MATQLNARALTTNEQAGNGGYTHMVVIDHSDLTETTDATAQVFNIAPTLVGDTIVKYALIVKTPFDSAAGVSDADSTTVSFGDAGSATRFISAVEANVNGTEVLYTYGNTAYTYLAAGQLKVTVNADTAFSVAELTTGQIIILFELLRHSTLAAAQVAG